MLILIFAFIVIILFLFIIVITSFPPRKPKDKSEQDSIENKN